MASTTPARHTSSTTTGALLPTQGGVAREAFSKPAKIFLALTRVSIGWIFLWAFLDKTFGLGYATPAARAWINGGSPTKGFLSNLAAGPFRGFFSSFAGAAWADWLFMLGLLGIGVALILGVGMRIAMVAAPILLVLMWAAEWPMARFGYDGQPTGSNNPFMDDHLIYSLVIISLALIGAGRFYGLGKYVER